MDRVWRRSWYAVVLGIVFLSPVLGGESDGWRATRTASKTNARDVVVSKKSIEEREEEREEKREEDPLWRQVQQAIDITSRRRLDADVHTPWQILHGILALRKDLELTKNGDAIPAIEWLASGPSYDGQPVVQVTAYGGRLHPYTRPYAFEGHANQFLAILTWSNLPMDFRFQAGNQSVTLADLVRNAQMEVNERDELTWTLWALSGYLPPESEWTNRYGQRWSIERLIQLELHEFVEDAACGGTHRLFALTVARNRYLQTSSQLAGPWLEADQRIRRYVEIARSFQNNDGSFSTSYFTGHGYSRDLTDRLTTSGHMLEWLMIALPEQRLSEDWVRRGVSAVAQDLIGCRTQPVDCGPLYHALHGVVLYRDRIQQQREREAADVLARNAEADNDSGVSTPADGAGRTSVQ